MSRKEGVVNHHPFNKTSFLNFFYARCRPPHTRRSLYTPPVETPAPSTPRQTAQHRQQEQTVPDAKQTTQGTAHEPRRRTRGTGLHSIPETARGDRGCAGCWMAWNVSETEQKRTGQNPKNKYAKKRKYLLTFTQESV